MFEFNFECANKEGIKLTVDADGSVLDAERGGSRVFIAFDCLCYGYDRDSSRSGTRIYVNGSFEPAFHCVTHKWAMREQEGTA